MVINNTCGIIGEQDTNNMAENLVSPKIELIISYRQNRESMAIHNIPMVFVIIIC